MQHALILNWHIILVFSVFDVFSLGGQMEGGEEMGSSENI